MTGKADARQQAQALALLDLLVQKYKAACFTSTKVQILTPEELRVRAHTHCGLYCGVSRVELDAGPYGAGAY